MYKILKSALLVSVAVVGFSAASEAKDLGDGVWAKERFQIRARAIGIFADGDGDVNNTTLETDVGDAVTPEVDLTYFITENIAVEAIAATAQHSVDAGPNDLGDTWILPPTVTLQYHFTPDNKFSPYVGAGINYSLFYGEDDGAGFNDLDVEGGFGFALQAGFDYWLSENWGINVDAKYVDLQIDADVKLGATPLSADDIDLNPWIIGAGVSYRF